MLAMKAGFQKVVRQHADGATTRVDRPLHGRGVDTFCATRDDHDALARALGGDLARERQGGVGGLSRADDGQAATVEQVHRARAVEQWRGGQLQLAPELLGKVDVTPRHHPQSAAAPPLHRQGHGGAAAQQEVEPIMLQARPARAQQAIARRGGHQVRRTKPRRHQASGQFVVLARGQRLERRQPLTAELAAQQQHDFSIRAQGLWAHRPLISRPSRYFAAIVAKANG
ncbi:MAG: hypothetical protein QM805_29125 [Pseudomonas sp.]